MYHDHARLCAECAIGRWEIDRVDAPQPGGPVYQGVCWEGMQLLQAWMELERLLPNPETQGILEEIRAVCQRDKEALIACYEALAPEYFPGRWLPACTAWDDVVQGLTPESDINPQGESPRFDEVDVSIVTFDQLDRTQLIMAGVAALTGYTLPEDGQRDAATEMALWVAEHEEVLIPIREVLHRNAQHLRTDLDSNPLLALSVAKFEAGARLRDEILKYEATQLPRMASEG